MNRRRILALAGLTVLATACTPWELNDYGAHLRGAPVTNVGGGRFVTGGARWSEQQCIDGIAAMEPWLNPDTRWLICQVNRGWVWGEWGYTRNATK